MAGIERDVIIAGAGPAGAICAAYLARAGIDVLLLDKEVFPRDKACGDMLQEGIVGHIHRLEASEHLDEMSVCVRNVELVSNKGKRVVIPHECYCVPRFELDKLLTDTAVSWGSEFRQDCRVLDVIKERGAVKGVNVKYRGVESEIRAKIVIGADGASSAVAKSLGIMNEKSSGVWLGQRAYFKGVKLDRSLARGQYEAYGVFCFDAQLASGYFWILPVGKNGVKKGICNVGMVLHDRDSYKGVSLQGRFRHWLENSQQIADMFRDATQISSWAGGKLTDMTQQTVKAGDGFMLIGDAASMMEPLYNDGLSAAGDSAKAASEAAIAAFRRGDFSGKLLEARYEAALKGVDKSADAEAKAEKLADRQKCSRLLMESMYDPEVMDLMIEKMAREKALGR